jgi:hypothetical protein
MSTFNEVTVKEEMAPEEEYISEEEHIKIEETRLQSSDLFIICLFPPLV